MDGKPKAKDQWGPPKIGVPIPPGEPEDPDYIAMASSMKEEYERKLAEMQAQAQFLEQTRFVFGEETLHSGEAGVHE